VSVPSLGWQLIDWSEFYLCHGPGDIRGEAIEVDDEFAAFIVKAYALDDAGKRKVNRAFISRPKGRAKSELAGMITCAELLGPVRFDHWAEAGEVSYWGYEYEQGEPVGRPVKDPFIRCLATEEGQAGNTYDNVMVMLENITEHHAGDFPKIDVGLTRIFVSGGGEVRPSTASSSSKDGGKETFAVADETHLWVLPDLRVMHDTVTRNLVKRKIAQPWMLETSTMYQPGQDSVAENTHEYWRAIKAGKVKDRGLLFDHKQGDIPKEWDDDQQMLAGLKQSYGAACEWMDLERILAEIRDPKTTKASTCRYFLNRAIAEEVTWLNVGTQWAPYETEVVLEPGTPIALGFDGSDSDDNTALVGVTMSTPPHFFVLGVWGPPPNAPEGWLVPRQAVHATVEEAFAKYEVASMLADPPRWRDELSTWAGKFGDDVVSEFHTNSWQRMARAVDRLNGIIVTGQFSHDGDPVLTQHVKNCHKMPVNQRRPELGFALVKDKKMSPRKIDAAVAMTLACHARGLAIENGWVPKGPDPEPWVAWD
jgi:phage terminase large subunit-like protein